MSDTEEEFVAEEDAELTPASVKRLREKLATCVKEKQEYLEGWQRSRADFVNFKKEESKLLEEKEERIKADLIEELLPALDVLELSLRHEDNKTLSMLNKQFLDSLKKIGIEQFGTEGEEFNPHRHEALDEGETDDKTKDHTILKVERKGYSAGERIIRPAQVIVAIYKK